MKTTAFDSADDDYSPEGLIWRSMQRWLIRWRGRLTRSSSLHDQASRLRELLAIGGLELRPGLTRERSIIESSTKLTQSGAGSGRSPNRARSIRRRCRGRWGSPRAWSR